MEWLTFLVFPAFTVEVIALGLALHSINQMKNMEKRMERIESKKVELS